MTTAIGADDYCVLGLATCYLREEGQFYPVEVIEPIPSAALEAILKGVPTSFQWAFAVRGQAVMADGQLSKPPAFPETAQFCDDFLERFAAAVRTYQSRPQAQAHIPLGTISRNFNYSLERKRVLNATKVVRPEDNVKQHPLTHQTL
jgi:hypothetical protein